MKKTGRAKIICSLMLAAITASAAGSGSVFAAEKKTEKNTNLGTVGIVYPQKPGSDEDRWSGSYVYFGKYGDDKEKTPIRFRVLERYTNKYGGDSMLLESDSILFEDYFD